MSTKQTAQMVCALREFVMAQYALNRARTEFYKSFGGAPDVTAEARIDGALAQWLDGEEVDPRSVDVADLSDILKHLAGPHPAWCAVPGCTQTSRKDGILCQSHANENMGIGKLKKEIPA